MKWNGRSSPTQKSKTTLSSLIPPNSTPSLRWRWENWCHTISFTKPPAWWPPRQRWIKNVPVTQKQLSLPPSLRAKHTTTLDCIPCNFRTIQNDKVMSFSKLFREKGNWYQSLQAQMAIPGTPGTWHWATKAPNPSACLSLNGWCQTNWACSNNNYHVVKTFLLKSPLASKACLHNLKMEKHSIKIQTIYKG